MEQLQRRRIECGRDGARGHGGRGGNTTGAAARDHSSFRLWRWCAVGAVWLTAGGVLLPGELPGNSLRDDPFGFFRPWVVVSNSDLTRLDKGDVVVRTLPGKDGQVVVFGVARSNATPDRLIAWTHAIADLKRSPFVLAVARFSDPPALEDLDGLRLDDRDLDAIRQCQPGHCGLKLGEDEIGSLRRAVEPALFRVRAGADWGIQLSPSRGRRVEIAHLCLHYGSGSSGRRFAAHLG